ncbi:ABC transporter family substrate-binding protein [Williamsia phyllosphaerae]|uniref:Lipoprotein LpqW n=1 Tax=Williamsia phyllosphaerae TaxID=885042 RepID=A0ABQ1UU24_9NOCA|nr:ABC transporter family substrate-binding protein [Williamsia phyllosphaerae]GGF26802.1 putative lipoprotein LpqW [Williamsia phyllosphaerae]
MRCRGAARVMFALWCVVAVATAACTADPPPPVQQSEAPPPPTDVPQGQTISVATDTIGVGFNPHLSADQSPVTAAVAAMTLPSAFTPVATPTGVAWFLDPAVLIGAEVTSQSPFTVTYRIAQDAQWSDGLPVTGEDFSYLWEQMSRQPGTVAPAGYRLIDDVASRAGGKEAVVRFKAPYPAWRELFTSLLPSHALRGVPDGFQTGMDSGLPVSAGRFAISGIDPSRDEIRLQRNDRYWRTPAVVDQIVLHRVGTSTQLAESVRSSDTRVVAVAGGPALAGSLGAIPGVVTGRTAVGRSLGITLNTRSPIMSDVAVRQGILGLVDTQVLIDAGAGAATVTPFANTVYQPSDPGYFLADRSVPDAAAVAEYFATGGYFPVPAAASTSPPSSSGASSPATDASATPTTTQSATDGGSSTATTLPQGVVPLQRGGKTLEVRIGVVAGDTRTRAAADSLSDQLRGAGVLAEVRALSAPELYGTALTDPSVDIVVGWQSAGVSPATRLASSTECDTPRSGAPGTSATPTPSGVVPTTVAPSASPTTTPDRSSATGDERYASNVSGLCDRTLADLANRALSAADPTTTLREAETAVAAQHVYLPVFQDSVLTAVGPGTTNVRLDGPVATGIFGNSGTWGIDRG